MGNHAHAIHCRSDTRALPGNSPHWLSQGRRGQTCYLCGGKGRGRAWDRCEWCSQLVNSLSAYGVGTGVDGIWFDETVDPHWAIAVLPMGFPVQGNLDPLALIAGGRALETAVENILSAFENRPHIFNLGHGILPDTPIDHVEMLLNLIRKERP